MIEQHPLIIKIGQHPLITDGVMILACAVYHAPTLIAALREHRKLWPITLWTTLAGWTGIIWVVMLFWSLNDNVEPRKIEGEKFMKTLSKMWSGTCDMFF